MTKSEWEEGRDKTVLAEANIMYKGSDAREYGTHSKAGWHVIELEKKKKTMSMGNGGVVKKGWNWGCRRNMKSFASLVLGTVIAQ